MRASDPDVVAQALRLYAEGARMVDITRATGLSASTIKRAQRLHGGPSRRTGRPYVYPADAPYRSVNAHGYVVAHAPQHPYMERRRSKNILEHVRVMECHLGRRLALDESVHHKNHDKQDNRLENLELMKKGEHSRHHRLAEFASGKKPFGGKAGTWQKRDPVTGRLVAKT